MQIYATFVYTKNNYNIFFKFATMKNCKKNSMNNSNEAYNRILKAIVNSELKPGDAVAEIQLAERFGFGRTPVREAIMLLENEGFIVSTERKKKIYVLFPTDIEEIFSIKQAIESSISWRAAEIATPEAKQELKHLLAEMEGLTSRDDAGSDAYVQKWLELDAEFHRILFKMGRNARAENIVDNLNLQFRRIKVGMSVLEGRVEKAIKEHCEIGTAILEGDGKKASRLMYSHLENVKQTIIKLMNTFYYTP